MEVPPNIPKWAPGARFEGSCEVSEAQLDLAVQLTGGRHPVHVSEQAARDAGFRGRIFHGAVTGAIMTAVIGANFRDERVALLGQKNRYRAPVSPGDTLRTEWLIYDARATKRDGDRVLILHGRMTNQEGALVLDSEAEVLLRGPLYHQSSEAPDENQ